MQRISTAEQLSEEELLGKFLPKESARQLLHEYRSIYQIMFRAPKQELESIPGISRINVKKLSYMREVLNRLQKGQREEMQGIKGPEDVMEYFRFLEERPQEEFWLLLLNTKNKIIKSQQITIGTLMASLVAPRETFHAAIDSMAAGIIAVHNHPSGDSQPSQEDLAVTERLIKSGKVLDIPLLDHVIIARNGGSSLREKARQLWET